MYNKKTLEFLVGLCRACCCQVIIVIFENVKTSSSPCCVFFLSLYFFFLFSPIRNPHEECHLFKMILAFQFLRCQN